jgi:hypothetical protein
MINRIKTKSNQNFNDNKIRFTKTKLYTAMHAYVTEQVNDVHRVYEYVM